MSNVIAAKLRGKEVFGHPVGLFFLFFAEMWERMSYYGMRALLVLYMVTYLLPNPEKADSVLGLNFLRSILESGFGSLGAQPLASHIYGLYTGFVYLSPFFGGILADRIWGKRKSVYIGGGLMAIGHFLMAFENLFLPALFFLIMGNGAFKPNVSTQVGSLYPKGDSRRDGAFTIFYMGINLGAFFSPFLCSNFAKWFCNAMGITNPGAPWHIGFALAGIGMLVGLFTYHMGRELFPLEDKSELAPQAEHKSILLKTVGGLLGIMVGFMVILMIPNILKAIVIAGVIVGVVYAIRSIEGAQDRARVASLVVLSIGAIFFWAIFEQQGNTLQLWAEEKADWAHLGLQPENYQAFNPMFIFIFAPLLDMWWGYRAAKGKKISSVRKMGIGCMLAGSAFLVIPLLSHLITVDKSLTNMALLALMTWMFTMGELYLSPIGMSLFTKVAPLRFMSMMMGLWFMSSFLGNYLAGALGGLYSQLSMTQFFLLFAVLGGVVGVFFFLAEGKLHKIIGQDV
ncbi:MAG: peptide MFS transporter [Bdellovibrionaceae bacterium]|nr:peptide MFS transporter [Pseudobdellovibrionaceae bacterium]